MVKREREHHKIQFFVVITKESKMASAWQVRCVLRAAGRWKSSEVLTGAQGSMFNLVPSLNTGPLGLTRSLFVCSRSLLSPQSSPSLNSGVSQARVPVEASGILTPKLTCVCVTRGKSKKSRKNKYSQKQNDDDDDTEDEDEDEDMKLETGSDFRELKARVPSLRIDAILKSGLNMSRNKVESAFYDSRIRINGKKLLKKSQQCHMGDEIDVIKIVARDNPNNLYVSRVVVVALGDTAEDEEKVTVKLRRYPNLLVECYKDYKVPQQE